MRERTMNNSIESLKQHIAHVRDLHASGALSQAQYDEQKAGLERQLLDLVLTSAAAPAAPAAPQVTAASSRSAAEGKRRPSAGLLAGLGALVVLLALGGYFWTGHPELLQPGATARLAAATAEQAAAEQARGGDAGGAASHTVTPEQIAAMVDKLAAHLKAHPDDAEGWTMLARTYSVLQRQPEALKAYEKALALRKDDPSLLTDYADVLAVNNGGNLDGEPMKLLEKALKLDPKNLKALALVGTYAFNNKDYANAAKLWEKLVQIGPADSVFVKQIIPGLVEARKLAGLPPLPPSLNTGAQPPLEKTAVPPPAAAGGGGASVSGTVTLSPALAKQASPDDTIFIFARPAQGSRMPLATLRRQVKDLPLHFTLDDSMAMSPADALSSASKVIVGARISKSGNAMPQAGDLQGLSGVVAVGSSNVEIEIKDAVKP